jgi:hypothetical protein
MPESPYYQPGIPYYRLGDVSAVPEHHVYGTAPYKLKQWLEDRALPRYKFAHIMRCSDSFMQRVVDGQARPSGERMAIIEALTEGQIEVKDWFPSGFLDSYIEKMDAYMKAWRLEEEEKAISPNLPRRYSTGGGGKRS